MTRREALALSGSILVHIGLVSVIGAGLLASPRAVQRIEIDLQGAKGAASTPGAQAPKPSQAPPLPSPSALPIQSAVPLKLSRPQQVVSTVPESIEPEGNPAAPDLPDLPVLPGLPAVALTRPDRPGTSAGGIGNSSGKGETGKGQGTALDGYFAAVRRRVDSAKKYPQIAQQRRDQGRVLVSFGLTTDGQLVGGPQLVKSSGCGLLDRAAVRAVRRGAPYPEFPGPASELPERLEVEVTFVLR